MKIKIPCDDDGMVMLECSLCGEEFKVMASDYNDESTLNIWCPYCGLIAISHVTDDVKEKCIKIATNEVNKLLLNAFKDLEKQTKSNKFIKIKNNFKPKDEVINPIKIKTTNLEIKKYKCCDISAKIKPLVIECGSYCPICVGIDFE